MIDAQKALVLATGAACFLAFSWGTLRHFRPVGPMPLGMRLVGGISLLTMAVFTGSVVQSPLSAAWPLAPVLSAGALALFTWTVRATREKGFALAFAGAQPSSILETGPYRYVRHPFYTSYLLFWAATGVATGSGICWIGPMVLLACYAMAARREEHLIMRSRLAAEYSAYVLRTGMFLPWRRRAKHQFSQEI